MKYVIAAFKVVIAILILATAFELGREYERKVPTIVKHVVDKKIERALPKVPRQPGNQRRPNRRHSG